MEVFIEPLPFVLALILVSAGWRKLRDPYRFTIAASRMLATGQGSAAVAIRLVAIIEIVLALAMLLNVHRRWAHFAVAALWLGYACLLAVSNWRGDVDYDCGCSFSAASHKVNAMSVVQPVVLSLCAFALTQIPSADFRVNVFEDLAIALAVFSMIVAAAEVISASAHATRLRP